MNDFSIRICSVSAEEDHPGHSESVRELGDSLGRRDYAVSIEDLSPLAARDLDGPYAEEILIFIGTSTETAVVSVVVADIYSAGKDWAKKRFKKAGPDSLVEFHIYESESDSTPLLTFTINRDGEREDIRN
jgi:hypothetical protein